MTNYDKLLQECSKQCKKIVSALTSYVREQGENFHDRDYNGYNIFRETFGLTEEDEGEERITKVLDFYGNCGCYFFESASINDDTCDGLNEENFNDKLYEGAAYTAYQCLYIVVDANGVERLKYYRFVNGGISFDEDQAEPDHDYASKLPLTDLDNIIAAIGLMQRK